MPRPPVVPAEEKTRIVLSILAGEVTVAEAARRSKVSEQSVGTGSGRSARPVERAWPRAAPARRPVKPSLRPRSRT